MSSMAARKRNTRQNAAANRDAHQLQRQAAFQLADNRPTASAQLKSRNLIQNSSQAIQRQVVQLKNWYAYGSANTVPHVHCYNGGSHLKIHDRGSVKRYNIVQNGSVHSQSESALNAAAGNADLTAVIKRLIKEANGVSNQSESDTDSNEHEQQDDFPSMTAMWNKIGWDLKGGKSKRR